MQCEHVIDVEETILVPDDGLTLGNGDLSVCLYQAAGGLVFRFGKSDVWDRRLDLSDDPKPVDIDELARGIRDEGWKCGPYGGRVEATKGAKEPERMRAVCQGCPPSYHYRPYPCPKPAGELALHLPPNLSGLRVRQRLRIEAAVLEIHCTWAGGIALDVNAFIPPTPNVLVVEWALKGWPAGLDCPPIFFSLYRWADPPLAAFFTGVCAMGDGGGSSGGHDQPVATPLPPPACRQSGDLLIVEQTFHAEPTFPNGFSCLLSSPTPHFTAGHARSMTPGEARLRLRPKDAGAVSGWMAAAVTTTSDAGGAESEARRVAGAVAADPAGCLEAWRRANAESARAFWGRSGVSLGDAELERTWYETLHARRCHYRAGKTAPGLFLPSSLRDYTHWHGDYHLNYNLQSPYWGDYTANHVDDLADNFFEAMEYMFQIGRKIARDYYHCRGVFIQLSGYPGIAADDWLGIVPMGRMAYMTGWVANHYWWRYLYTRDQAWLASRGYPAIRDCALFYTDFLKKGTDGLYHAFPSNQGEDGFTGDPKDYTDRPQIMRHMRYCLRAAIQAAEALETDADLRDQWRDLVCHAAADDGVPGPELGGMDPALAERLPPEFFGQDGGRATRVAWADRSSALYAWYFGKVPWTWMTQLRSRLFDAGRDLAPLRDHLRRWRRPNGLLTAMDPNQYGHIGAWAESLGIIAPIQELLLQSWTGVIDVFPAWPVDVDAEFRTLRAEGAFLVSAAWQANALQRVSIVSEASGECRVRAPWGEGTPVVTDERNAIIANRMTDGIVSFAAKAGTSYAIRIE